MNKRDTVKKIKAGSVEIGGGAPVSVQTMCNTKTWDVDATVAQIKAMQTAGADIVRHEQGADPAAVVFDATSAAKARRADTVSPSKPPSAASIRSASTPATSARPRTSRQSPRPAAGTISPSASA